MNGFLPNRKGILALLLALCLGMGTVYAYDFSATCSTGQTLYYNIIDATNHYVEITYPGTSTSNPWQGYTKPTGNITLPSFVTYNGYTYHVKRMGDYAFRGCFGLTGSLTIPNGVTSIGDFAFYNCYSLTGSLTIGNSVTSIGDFAFYNCYSLTGSLTIGNSVTSIGDYTFNNCSGFTQVNFNAVNCADVSPESHTFYDCGVTLTIGSSVQRIPAWMFYGCSGFTGSLTIPNSVTEIGEGAFADCSGFTGSLTIGNSVTSIGDYAFYQCNGFTGTLTLGNSVTTIGSLAFYYCSDFTQVNYNAVNCANVAYDDKPFEGCGGALTIGGSVQRIPACMFYECSGFTGSLTIPNSVTEIGMGAFYQCSGFTGTLTLGNSLTEIGASAFASCSGFTGSLTIPNSVTTIGNTAFAGCSGFTGDLTIGNSVTEIWHSAFQDCSGFTGTLTIGNSVTSIRTVAFSGCGFTQVNYNAVNCADVAYDDKPFQGCGGTLTIGGSVQRIPACMFYECSGFTGSLTIPNSVTEIGMGAFYQCSGFTGTLTLGNSLTEIGASAFASCSGFTGSLTIPNSVTTIGNTAFAGCSGFTGDLTIGNSVTEIWHSAFQDCSGFTGTLTIGNSVTSIHTVAFSGCSGFTGSLTIPNSVTKIGNNAFYQCSGFTGTLTLGNSLIEIGTGAFRNCSGFTGSLTIPNSVTKVGSTAFHGCSGFTGDLTIGNSVTEIGSAAFQGCSGFTGTLTIGNSVRWINPVAFSGCGFTQVNYNAVNCADVDNNAKPFQGCGGTLTIGGSVQRIPAWMFYECSGFTGSLTIGNSVTSIGDYAFYNCNDLTLMIVYPKTPPTLGSNVFYNVPTTIPVYVPCVSLEDYQAAPGWSEFTNMQCIQETLTVYDGSASNYYVPAYISYFDEFTKSQFVIPAADLADMTGTPLNSMTFYTTGGNVPYTTVSSADVYLKEVNYTNISDFEPKASATTVYSGYLDIVSTNNGGEMTINFSTPYTYNGGNLLVGIENTETNGWKIIYFHGKHVNGASVSGSSSSSLESVQPAQQNFIPKTTFGYTPTECSRPIDLTATDITSNSAMLNWTGFQDEYDVRYRTKPLFFEGFENGLPSDWTTIDNDGDGYNWYHYSNSVYNYAHSGTRLMGSASWQGTALTPDNWLVTPLLQLQGTMKVWLSANSSTYQDEHFAIYLSTTGNSVSDFTTVLVPETVTSSEYVCYTADLSAYAGQQGYIAIRHFNCTDMDRLRLDDFGIYDDPDADEWELALSTNNQLLIGNLEPNTEYEWQVRGRDCEGSGTFTEWSAAHSFTTKCEAFVVDAGNPFTEDFESAVFAPACWENISSGIYQWRSDTDQSHSSSHSAFSGWYGDIYLVLPDLELSADAEAVQLSFWSYNSYPSDFAVGNNTVVLLNGGTETVLWSAETVNDEWVKTTIDLTDYLGQTVSLAFKYAGDNGNGWYVDDVEVSVPSNVTQAIVLTAGSNWFSTYVDITLEDLQNALVAALPSATSITIKGRTQSSFYNGNRWRGALSSLDLALMYQITVPQSCEITLEGMAVDPAQHPLTIKNGPNWIGFPFSESMTLDQAFPGFPVSGDKIQSKNSGQAIYSNRWRGALNTLVPGQGYIYKSNSAEDRVFTFPTGAK